MQKDFDTWNKEKKVLELKDKIIYCHPREIWWSSLGLNIGIETDGKNKKFERPVLILKTYYKSALILPITTIPKNDKYHYNIKVNAGYMYIKLTQARTIDIKRLLRKIDTVPKNIFMNILQIWKDSI